jgi:hypothetical protein
VSVNARREIGKFKPLILSEIHAAGDTCVAGHVKQRGREKPQMHRDSRKASHDEHHAEA